MDFNYLYYRQQVELMRSDAARTKEGRRAHRELAALYTSLIQRRIEAARLGAY